MSRNVTHEIPTTDNLNPDHYRGRKILEGGSL